MNTWLTRRLLLAVLTLLVASAAVFALAATVDPLAADRTRPGVTVEQLEERERELGLDDPLIERYLSWLSQAVRGDLGRSYESGDQVTALVGARLLVSLRLALLALLLSWVTGIAVGTIAAVRRGTWTDRGIRMGAAVALALPVVWLGVVLKEGGLRLNDAVGRRVVFTIGEATPGFEGGWWATLGDRVGHLLLPVLTIVIVEAALLARYQRAALLEVLRADHIRTAEAKGASRARIVVHHGLRVALLPVIAVQAVQLGTMVGGLILVERIFAWQGMGDLLTNALLAGDLPVIQGWLLVAAVAVVLGSFLAELVSTRLDPRIRRD